ncbi:hypothetical protein CONLIGDRAFT_633995 [Coniochaeta ligniaria NRRL 30616]|uniref:Uncharacterized protein n=1 Tax=Coniochaeta ligniaria NRRL 30616 TaxID=1408157 RepID=A0A1J7IIY5_9PEZI|nr:hypothetical protein CONLIGDRAFT_633995 [Coniochaeta ligniaria NRRL 30616]
MDQVEAWKEHVLSHYHDDATLLDALGDNIPCWILDCPTTLVASSKADRKDMFLTMMNHVYHHMNAEVVDHNELRKDDHFTILTLWNDFEHAYASGSGISMGEMEFLYTQHVRPRGSTWSWAAARFGEMQSQKEDTGKRDDLRPYDERKEKRALERLARDAKTDGEGSK